MLIGTNADGVAANLATNQRQDRTIAAQGSRLSTVEGNVSQNSQQVLENSQRIDAFASSIDAFASSIEAFGAAIQGNAQQISENTGGIAVAMSMAGGTTLSRDAKFGVGANWGTYGGEHGASFSMTARLTPQLQLNAGVGFTDRPGTTGGRAGLWYEW